MNENVIIVIGGGFAGVRVTRDLLRRRLPGTEVLLISEESYTTYNPMLPEAVGAAIFPEHVVAPLRQVADINKHGRFVMGRVTSLDAAGQRVTCRTLAGEKTFAYDQAVLALGVRARLDLMPGMAEHALPLKTVGDAMFIRNTVLRRLARIELEDDPVRRASLGHFIVLGGGFSGVEVAGELVDSLKSMARYYPRVAMSEIKLTLVHGDARLLPEMPPVLGSAALKSLQRRGVHVRLNALAAEVRADGVLLKDGTLIEGDTVVGTIGTQPNGLVATLGLPVLGGRLKVTPELRVEGHDNIWAAGDCATVVDASNPFYPATAQVAVPARGAARPQHCREHRGRVAEAVSLSPSRVDGRDGPSERRRRNLRLSVLGLPRLAGLALLLSHADADGRSQIAHFRRVELGRAICDRYHASALHPQPRRDHAAAGMSSNSIAAKPRL